MAKVFVKAISGVALLLLLLITGLYVQNPDPASAPPIVGTVILGSIGALILLVIAIVGTVMKDADFGTY